MGKQVATETSKQTTESDKLLISNYQAIFNRKLNVENKFPHLKKN